MLAVSESTVRRLEKTVLRPVIVDGVRYQREQDVREYMQRSRGASAGGDATDGATASAAFDGSIDAWTSAQKRVLPEELEADQRKLVKTHVARHPHGPLAKAFAEHTARVRALRLWQARAPRRPTASRHTSAPRAPRAARRVRRAASPLARSPDEPPSSEGGEGPPPDAEPWGAP